jgi:hypothetical protein
VGWFPGAGFEAAWASAWLLPPGDGQIITYSAFSDSTRAFDGHGNLIPVPDYQKFELGTYVEYGVTDWLTVSAAPAYDRVQTPVPGQSYMAKARSPQGSGSITRMRQFCRFRRACVRQVRRLTR